MEWKRREREEGRVEIETKKNLLSKYDMIQN